MNTNKIAADKLRADLKRVFGLTSFRPGQREVIASVLAGRDTLAILPTGAGKSLCYQLPGQARQGTTVVVSPLISLMRDQAEKLDEMGLAADQVNSSLSRSETEQALGRIAASRSEFVFATPERMEDPEFIGLLSSQKVDLFVVDEAHCISQWGHDFRPAYLQLKHAIEVLGHPPVLALTATATEDVVADIIRQLGMRDARVIQGGVYRDNLHYEVQQVVSEEDKAEHLIAQIARHDGPGIIYCATVKSVEEVYQRLLDAGQSVARYHGQMGARQRAESQDVFMRGETRIMVATNAFGMGIDKPDIRFIIHYQMPGNLAAYYQETGRAGRDGDTAACVLLYHAQDKRVQQFFLARRFPDADILRRVYRGLAEIGNESKAVSTTVLQEHLGKKVSASKTKVALKMLCEAELVSETEEKQFSITRAETALDFDALARPYEEKDARDREALEQMVFYAQTGYCRWRVILAGFGEEPEWEHCGHCDNCIRPPEEELTPIDWPAQETGSLNQETAAEAGLQVGSIVETPRFGAGRVTAMEDDKATVELGNGSSKTFLASRLRLLEPGTTGTEDTGS